MLAHRFALVLRGAYLAMHRRTDAALARVGITADQFVVLAALTAGDTLSQRELVTRTNSDPNTLRAMLVLLERRGLVERREHPTDRRARSVLLTRRGHAVYRRAWRASERLREQMLAALPSRQMTAVTKRLSKFAAELQPSPADASKSTRKSRSPVVTNSSSSVGALP